MVVSTVKELIAMLELVEDKSLPVRLLNSLEPDEENIWLHSVGVTSDDEDFKGQSGEVRLLGAE